jgi:hypothetical protein
MASSFFPDFKYFGLIHGRHTRRDLLLNLRTAELRPVASAFFNNIARMDSFSVFPAVVAAEALQDQLWRDCATFKVTGKVSIRPRKHSKKTEAAIAREIKKIAKAQYRRFASGDQTEVRGKVKVGADQINEMLSHEHGSNQSMEAIMFSVVIESWMAFETLAADLWFMALDYGPAEWRNRTLLKSSKFKKGDDSEAPIDIDPHKMSDVGKKFGSALREADKISFQKLRLISFWYKTAFGREIGKLFEEVKYISALSAVRNVIIHKAAKADATYVNAVRCFPELKTVDAGKLIQLDGDIIRELQNASILLGSKLVLYVDDAITPKKP